MFLARTHAQQLQRVIAAISAVAALPGYREEVLARAPAIARPAPANPGVFFGFDFHINETGPKLIEINTNAGGALLNIEIRRQQQACCEPAAAYLRDENYRRIAGVAHRRHVHARMATRARHASARHHRHRGRRAS